MLQLEELKAYLNSLTEPLDTLKEALKLAVLAEKVAELELVTMEENFWGDSVGSSAILKELSGLKSVIAEYETVRDELADVTTLCEMALEEQDNAIYPELKSTADSIASTLEMMKLRTMLTGEYDSKNAIVTFHPGAGGVESQDWAQMLYRMYTRWAARRGFKVKVLDYLGGDEAGIKSAAILIEGQNAYGFLRSEGGVHRLVRLSPFDASGRRHTSFAAIEVMPEIDDDVSVAINETDLKIDTYRAGGAGGQHVNKTESAVRITHLPSGIVVACQNERSQHQNKEVAMKMLKAKLAEIKEREHLDRIEDIKGVQKEIAWGAQIRSYVFMPYTLVKDHRTGFEIGNISAVMDGDIDGFINAYLMGNWD